MKRWLRQMPFFLAMAAIVVGCAPNVGELRIPDPVPDDRRDIPRPKSRKIYHIADGFDQQFPRRLQRGFDLSRHIRHITDNPKQAYNVDALDEVPNSSWFTNRNHMEKLSLEAIARGANRGTGPDTSGTWTVIGAKTEGVTPGFTIKDSKGGRFIVKFDPPGYEEMATGAEIIGSRLFYAAGYNTPQNYLVHFRPEIVQLGEGVEIKHQGRDHIMLQADLDKIIDRLTVGPDGTVRAVASRFLEGKLLGPFRYGGTRKDDPNDFIPHEHRRDLRGLRTIASWLNHWDTKAGNSLDVWVEENGRHFVRHYLIDFGSTLGSQGDEPMPEWVGYETTVDTDQMLLNTIGLGIYVPAWEKNRKVEYTSIGLYDYETFEPEHYKPIVPNRAFVNATDRDQYWGAKIVASFTDDQLRAAVGEAHYSNPAAADYMVDILKKRRDIIARYFFDRMSPVDHFTVESGALGFMDLAVECGVTAASQRRYEYEVRRNGDVVEGPKEGGYPLRVPLPFGGRGVISVKIRTQREDGDWAKPVFAFVETDGNGRPRLVSVQRED